MQSLKQFFAYMNDISFPYVVLRNWSRLPYDVVLGEHSDLDLLVYDFGHWKEIFPEAHQEYPYPRVRFKIPIDDSYVYVDVRHVGDGYYPEEFQNEILKFREWNERGFYTPCRQHFNIALAYHIVHHKAMISDDYRRYIGDVTIPELISALKLSNIGWVEPKDKSVGSFNGYWKGCTAIVDSSNDRVFKTQVSWLDYPLIKNEYEILSSVDSRYFPKVFSLNGRLEMEDCGKKLLDNVPEDWRDQLLDIVGELKKYKVQHRDIRIDNLLVKDGVIKLIDFGWAKKEDDVEEKQPPTCLGFPNRPSWGFDDAYSMNRVIKQVEYHLEG